MNIYDDAPDAPMWVWAYAEAHGMDVLREFNIISYKEEKGEQI